MVCSVTHVLASCFCLGKVPPQSHSQQSKEESVKWLVHSVLYSEMYRLTKNQTDRYIYNLITISFYISLTHCLVPIHSFLETQLSVSVWCTQDQIFVVSLSSYSQLYQSTHLTLNLALLYYLVLLQVSRGYIRK